MTAKKRRKLVSLHESNQGWTISLLSQLNTHLSSLRSILKLTKTYQGAAAGGCQPSLIACSIFSSELLLCDVIIYTGQWLS
jgi:hypothetical protein